MFILNYHHFINYGTTHHFSERYIARTIPVVQKAVRSVRMALKAKS